MKLIEFRENYGFTGGVAAAAAASDAEFLALLNNDAVAEPGWLDAMRKAIEDAPADVVAVSGKITDMTGTLVDFVGGVMTFDGHAFQRGFRRPIGEVEEPETGSELLFACGGNMIVRRNEFLSLGGFDRDFFAYLEDVDFGWRAWSAGHRITYSRDAAVRHKSSATSDRLGNFERGVLFERNAIQTVIKNVEESLFAQALAPVFLTLLHREHRYLVDRNDGTESLTTPPLDKRGADRRSGTRRAVIDDPLTAMQFRATEWFFRHSASLMKKRARVQASRKRSDLDIFSRFPIHYVPTYHGDDELMSSQLFRALRLAVPSVDQRLDDMIRR